MTTPTPIVGHPQGNVTNSFILSKHYLKCILVLGDSLSRIQPVSHDVMEQPSLGYADTVTVGVQPVAGSLGVESQVEEEVAETYCVPAQRKDGQSPSQG